MAVSLFLKTMGWKGSAAVGCGTAALDESLKIILPMREFRGIDLLNGTIVYI